MWLKKIREYLFGKPRQLFCIHATGRFARCVLAAQRFVAELDEHPTAAIVCRPQSIIDILTALHIDVEDRVRRWKLVKRVELANKLIKDKFGDTVSLSTEETTADLLWLEGTDASNSTARTIIFSGDLSQEPLIEFWRSSTVRRGDVTLTGETPAHTKCSEWLNANP